MRYGVWVLNNSMFEPRLGQSRGPTNQSARRFEFRDVVSSLPAEVRTP